MRKLTSIAAAATLFLLSGGAAFAAGPTLSATVSGTGAPTISAPSDVTFSTVNLDGVNDKTSTGILDALTVTDATGTGNGWNVQFSASQLGSGTHTLAAGSLSMAGLTQTCASDNCSTGPAVSSAAQTLDNGTVTVADAAVNTGMGSYTLTPGSLSLAVPSNAYAGTYTSTLTITFASGPAA